MKNLLIVDYFFSKLSSERSQSCPKSATEPAICCRKLWSFSQKANICCNTSPCLCTNYNCSANSTKTFGALKLVLVISRFYLWFPFYLFLIWSKLSTSFDSINFLERPLSVWVPNSLRWIVNKFLPISIVYLISNY